MNVYPAISAKALQLDGMVSVLVYTTFKDAEGNDLDIDFVLEHGGVEITGLDGETVSHVKLTKGSIYDGSQEYTALSDGIPAKDMEKNFVFRPYITVDGKTVYGAELEYGVLTYVDNMMKKDSTKEKLKTTLVGLLNYGAAAQYYFDGRSGYTAPEVKMNACLQDYVDAGYLNAEYLELNWDGSLITPLQEPSDEMTVNFVQSGTAEITAKALALEGAVSVYYYVSVGSDLTNFQNSETVMYFWTQSDYDALLAKNEPLAKENASYTSIGGEYIDSGYGPESIVISEQFVAKEFGNTLYAVMCITDDNGTEHCSGVQAYSPEYYAERQISKNTKPLLVDLMKWMVTYGERAKINFGG